MNQKPGFQAHLYRYIFLIAMLAIIIIVAIYYGTPDKPFLSNKHNNGETKHAVLTNNAQYALVAIAPHKAALWDVIKDKKIKEIKTPKNHDAISDLAIANNGKLAITANNDEIMLWRFPKAELVAVWPLDDEINDVAITPTGEYSIVGLNNGSAEYLNLKTGEVIHQFNHNGEINSVDISQDGQYAVTGANDSYAKLWELKDGNIVQTWHHEKPINIVLISPQNYFAMTGAKDSDIKVWELRSGKLHSVLDTPPMYITSAAFSSNEQYLAIGCKPQIIQVWDLHNNKLIKEWTLPKRNAWQPTTIEIHAIRFTPDNNFIITEDSSGYNRIWDLRK